MNERLRELMIQAIADVDSIDDPETKRMYIPNCFAEKFAELLVWEFLEVVERQFGGGNNGSDEWDRAIDFTYEDVKKHFGVE